MKYTEPQINAALVVADFHAGLNNVKRDECDTAVARLAGAPLSAVLAAAYRSERELRLRTQGFQTCDMRGSENL